MPHINDENVIYADPSKEFFIDVLTKDISLSDCILDLIDNSIHSLIHQTDLDTRKILEGKKASKNRIEAEINVKFSPSAFSISDNCGGISIDDARKVVFKLGKVKSEKTHPGLSVFGVGMKRAMFKMGNIIEVKSKTKTEEFRIEIDVPDWKKQQLWDFHFDYSRNRKTKRETPGTKIAVTDLHSEIKRLFGLQSFVNKLNERVSATYGLFLESGVKIRINDKKVKSSLPNFAESQSLKTARETLKVDGVDILIMTGVTPSGKRPSGTGGWYVLCNGRLILQADKTDRTGWGENLPVFHAKYNYFLGYVYFRSKHLSKLPWKTSKEGVDFESPVYQKALVRMKILTRPVVNYLNKKYPDEIRPEGVAERELHESSTAVSIIDVAKNTKTRTFSAQTKKVPENKTVTIQYKRSKKEIEKVKKAIGKSKLSAARVGEYTFDDFLRRECD